MPWLPIAAGVGGLLAGALRGRSQKKEPQIVQRDIRTPEQKALQKQMAGIYREQLKDIQSGDALTRVLEEGEQHFEQHMRPGIQQAYAGPGTFWGSDRAQAETQGQQQFMDALRQQERQREQQVMQGAMGLSGMPTQFMHGIPPQEGIVPSLIRGIPNVLAAYLVGR